MVKVPEGIRVNSIPKELVTVFSKAKAEPEKRMLLKTSKRHTHWHEKFFNGLVVRRMATP